MSLARTGPLAVVIGILALSPAVAEAQSSSSSKPLAGAGLVVPTTKILAIGSFTPGTTPEQWKPLLASEAKGTAFLYLDGKIDQWYVKQDQSGVVFVLNLTDIDAAQQMLEKLPLGQAKFMTFQFIALGPLSPLRTLLGEAPPR